MMSQQEIITGVLINDGQTLSFVEVCQSCHLSEKFLIDLLEHGLLGDVSGDYKHVTFEPAMLARIRSAYRLHHDLEMDLQGVLMVLDLLDEMEKMHNELEILKRNVTFF